MERETPMMASFGFKTKSKSLKMAYKDLCDLATVQLCSVMLSLTQVTCTFCSLCLNATPVPSLSLPLSSSFQFPLTHAFFQKAFSDAPKLGPCPSQVLPQHPKLPDSLHIFNRQCSMTICLSATCHKPVSLGRERKGPYLFHLIQCLPHRMSFSKCCQVNECNCPSE